MTLVPPGRGEGIKTYDPKDVRVTFNGVEIKGFADGAFVDIGDDLDESCFVDIPPRHLMSGVKRSGTCTLTLMQEAPGNETLNDLTGCVSRLWSFDTEAFLVREAKKDRRRVRMARKKRRGWA